MDTTASPIDFGIPQFALRHLLFFGAAAFLGWILESTYRSLSERKFVNAGFLRGPFVPIYGFGALVVLAADRFTHSLPTPLRWTILSIAPSLVELCGGFIMEKALKVRLWDYSGEFLNFKGHVCLKFSAAWAILVTADVIWIQPFLVSSIARLTDRSLYLAGGGLISYLLYDTWQSASVYADFKRIMAQLKESLSAGKPLPIAHGLLAGKMPLEWKRFMRPLQSFPSLRNAARSLAKALPIEVLHRIERLRKRGSDARQRSREER